jgi:hypothetical protein
MPLLSRWNLIAGLRRSGADAFERNIIRDNIKSYIRRRGSGNLLDELSRSLALGRLADQPRRGETF